MLKVITPASTGVTAATSIPTPGAGKRLRIYGYCLTTDGTGQVFLCTAATQLDVNIVDTFYGVAGGGVQQARFEGGNGILLSANLPFYVVCASGNAYGHIDYGVESA